jgi:hypothetical protein
MCPLIAMAPEMWDWDSSKSMTLPYCLGERCALWDRVRCGLRNVEAKQPAGLRQVIQTK